MKRQILVLGITAIVISTFVIGCGRKSLEGNVNVNQMPKIYFANVPLADSIFKSNAELKWYGTDSDGRVMAYYYRVLLEEDVGDDPDAYIDSLILPLDTLKLDSLQWVKTESTTITVQLFASDVEKDTIPQYVFLTCVDNEGAFSGVIYRSFFRVNHLPQTFITRIPGKDYPSDSTLADSVWCLPDTNALWQGLIVSWIGDDTADFPEGDLPDFEYDWKLYYFSDTSAYKVNVLDSDSAGYFDINDTSDAELLEYSCDPEDGDEWVWDTQHIFVNLETGCYLFTVGTRDDALTIDTTLAWDRFMCFKPVWISDPDEALDVLLIQGTQFGPARRGTPSENNPPEFPDSIRNFYREMIDSTIYKYKFSEPIGDPLVDTLFPAFSEFARHRMVIVDDMDYMEGELESGLPFENILEKYLSIGGKAWVIGRQSFSGGTGAGPKDFGVQSIAFNFFDLSATNLIPDNTDSIAEFIGAVSVSDDFNDLDTLEFDTLKINYLRQYGVSKVEGLARYSNISETMFIYNAINPDTSSQHARPVAVRYYPENEIYKTSYFCFPLSLMDNSGGDVQHVFDVMLSWFLDEEY